MAMPEVPEGAKGRTVTYDELAAHRYEVPERPGGAWVAMGGQCFDASTLALEKTMIRNMCGQDGTAFVLRMRDAAYGDGVPARLSELSAAQLSYVASWATYMASHGCPCIGVMASEAAS